MLDNIFVRISNSKKDKVEWAPYLVATATHENPPADPLMASQDLSKIN